MAWGGVLMFGVVCCVVVCCGVLWCVVVCCVVVWCVVVWCGCECEWVWVGWGGLYGLCGVVKQITTGDALSWWIFDVESPFQSYNISF